MVCDKIYPLLSCGHATLQVAMSVCRSVCLWERVEKWEKWAFYIFFCLSAWGVDGGGRPFSPVLNDTGIGPREYHITNTHIHTHIHTQSQYCSCAFLDFLSPALRMDGRTRTSIETRVRSYKVKVTFVFNSWIRTYYSASPGGRIKQKNKN